MKKEDVEYPIQFLWDKWKHHDSLAYSRQTSAMVLQVAVITATVLTVKLLYGEGATINNCLVLFCLFVAWSVAAFATHVFIESQKIDIRVRNTFNKKIVEALLRIGILEGERENWRFGSHHVENNKHPINLWHTPYPDKEGENTRATAWNQKLMIIFMWLNVIVAGAFLVSFMRAMNQA